jgi:ketosteroid isomerase-like protein
MYPQDPYSGQPSGPQGYGQPQPGYQQPVQGYPQPPYPNQPQGQPEVGPAGPGYPPGYQQPNWYQQPAAPPRRTGLIIGIVAAVVVVAAAAVVLVLTLGGKKNEAAPPVTTSPVTSAGLPTTPPATNGGVVPPAVTTGAPMTSAVVPAGNALGAKATAERAALLISQGQPNVAGVYVCAAERQQFISENTAAAGVTVAITVSDVTENGSTAQAAVHVKAQSASTGQSQEGDSSVTLARNNAGAWYICTGQLGADDQSAPDEANAPAALPPSSAATAPPAGQTTGAVGAPGPEQAQQVAQSWAAAINSGDVATAQQYLCSSYQGPAGGTTTGVTLTLQSISQTGQDSAVAEFAVEAGGQQGTAQVAMKVESGRWTICQSG